MKDKGNAILLAEQGRGSVCSKHRVPSWSPCGVRSCITVRLAPCVKPTSHCWCHLSVIATQSLTFPMWSFHTQKPTSKYKKRLGLLWSYWIYQIKLGSNKISLCCFRKASLLMMTCLFLSCLLIVCMGGWFLNQCTFGCGPPSNKDLLGNPHLRRYSFAGLISYRIASMKW